LLFTVAAAASGQVAALDLKMRRYRVVVDSCKDAPARRRGAGSRLAA
jgi:hypothetical protein